MITGSYYCRGFLMDFLYIIHHKFWVHVHVPMIGLFIYSVWTLIRSRSRITSIIPFYYRRHTRGLVYFLEVLRIGAYYISRIPNKTENASSAILVGYILTYPSFIWLSSSSQIARTSFQTKQLFSHEYFIKSFC